MTRFLLGGLSLSAVVWYATLASHFYQQERWARAPADVGLVSPERLRHPEAVLGAARRALESGDFSDPIEHYLSRSLSEAPASYQSSFLLAVYLANRLEDPERTARAFDSALALFPANGRLHLSYAQWLFSRQAATPRWMDRSGSTREERVALRARALRHLRLAVSFQEDLIPDGLKLLAWGGVPASEWEEILPDTLPAKGELARALAGFGHRDEALFVLTGTLRSTFDGRFLRDAAQWAIEWGAPAVALDAATRWLEQERAANSAGSQFVRAVLLVCRAHLELGEPKSAFQVFDEAWGQFEADRHESLPAKVELLTGMAYLYARVDQSLMAQSLLIQASELAPHDPTIWLALARAYRKIGNEAMAVQSYREVLRLQPDHAEAKQEIQPLLLRFELVAGGS